VSNFRLRGLPIYGDLVLGVLYKKIKGKLEVEAIQLNENFNQKQFGG
jgi:hypothetical protein